MGDNRTRARLVERIRKNDVVELGQSRRHEFSFLCGCLLSQICAAITAKTTTKKKEKNESFPLLSICTTTTATGTCSENNKSLQKLASGTFGSYSFR